MRARLMLVLFVLLCVNGFEASAGKSKFVGFESKSLENNDKINDTIPDGPFCNSITALYIGTLQNKKSNKTYDVEFQVKLWADLNKKKIHVQADKWNEKYSKSENFELDYYFGGNREWCNVYDDNCVSPFAKKETSFKLDLNTADGNYFHLLNFNFFNNSFGLVGSKEKCTKHQLDGINDDNTPQSLFDKLLFCVCCDNYKPNKLLGCPNDEWSKEKPTQKPILATTQRPITSKPQPQNITCNEIVGYYNGIFQTQAHPAMLSSVEFQLRLVANDVNRRVSFTLDHWNNTKAKISDFELFTYSNEENPDCYNKRCVSCDPPTNKSCSIKFVDKVETMYFLFLWNRITGDWYNFLYFPNFNNIFTLTNAIGQCTKNQFQLDDVKNPNITLYEYCVCCGSEYKQDPALGCPKNQWA